jgi:hypothetical protein
VDFKFKFELFLNFSIYALIDTCKGTSIVWIQVSQSKFILMNCGLLVKMAHANNQNVLQCPNWPRARPPYDWSPVEYSCHRTPDLPSHAPLSHRPTCSPCPFPLQASLIRQDAFRSPLLTSHRSTRLAPPLTATPPSPASHHAMHGSSRTRHISSSSTIPGSTLQKLLSQRRPPRSLGCHRRTAPQATVRP